MPASDAKAYIPVQRTFQEIIVAEDELSACVNVWIRLRIDFENTTWKVGELGFDNHDDDIYFCGGEVARAVKQYQKKRKK